MKERIDTKVTTYNRGVTDFKLKTGILVPLVNDGQHISEKRGPYLSSADKQKRIDYLMGRAAALTNKIEPKVKAFNTKAQGFRNRIGSHRWPSDLTIEKTGVPDLGLKAPSVQSQIVDFTDEEDMPLTGEEGVPPPPEPE